MRFLKATIRLLKNLKFSLKPKLLIIYGNYGGAGYSARYTYDKTTGNVYELSEDGDFVLDNHIPYEIYLNFMLEKFKDCDPIDEFDCCFKLHDLDTNTNNISDILSASHALPINMARIDPCIYVCYPIIFTLGVIYFTTIGRLSKNPQHEQIEEIIAYRETCKNQFNNKFGIKLI
ncbi:hypothetical protein QLL95_gp1165 [Cotonvirus japonicus]|uniref:Uncharacterized protein n=1 Tax=Cotonvirus japonicus TaxID=2811091 RepID=A0ABM7NS21_9VIRU|nr:hypothetical protein QLL95_gp1165 [Cotonvirus japonicus]BCS82958.1 hypothetical protein [Cotonvirus japonicus]